MKFLISSFFIITFSTLSFGWGKYGHQQASSASIALLKKLLANQPLTACLEKNYASVVRLASDPDEVFKMNAQAQIKLNNLLKTDPEAKLPETKVLMARRVSNRVEHNLHFFQIDFLLPNGEVNPGTIKLLPSDPDFNESSKTFLSLIENNRKYINENAVDDDGKIAGKVSIRNVDRQGTAPQRVIQLYDLGVEALAKGDIQKGLFYLSLLSHYEADKGQPFHASGASFNGQAYVDPKTGEKSKDAIGVHSSFEEKILETTAKAKKFKLVDDVWQFGATEDDVVKIAKGLTGESLAPLTRSQILTENFNQVGSGAALVDIVQNAYAEAHQKVAATGGPKHKVDDLFLTMTVTDPAGKKISILNLAIERLGGATALLSRIWNQAYQDALAKNPKLGKQLASCEAYPLDRDYSALNYPVPKYLLDLGFESDRASHPAAANEDAVSEQ